MENFSYLSGELEWPTGISSPFNFPIDSSAEMAISFCSDYRTISSVFIKYPCGATTYHDPIVHVLNARCIHARTFRHVAPA